MSPLYGDLVEVVGLEGFGEGVDHSLCGPGVGHLDEDAVAETLYIQAFRMAGDIADPVIDPHPIPERDLSATPAGHAKNGSFLTGDECRIESHNGSANRSVPQLTRRRMHRPIETLRKLGRSDSFEESVRTGSHIEVGVQSVSAVE